MNRTTKTAALLAGVALVATGCSLPSAASDEILVHKGGGPFEDKKDKGCIQPANRSVESAFDGYYAYPTSQRVYAFTGGEGDDGAPFTVVSKDGQTLTVPGSLTFSLNIDCAVMQEFHDKVGNRYKAYMENGEVSEGWNEMLNIYFRPSLDATLDRVAKGYSWKQLYSDVSIKDEMNRTVNTEVDRLINQQFLGDSKFFTGFSALLQQPIADPELVAAVKKEETSKANASATTIAAEADAAATQKKAEADAKAAQAAATAQIAQKQAELKVAAIEAQITKAEIDSYGGPQRYNEYLLINKGMNPYRDIFNGNGVLATP